jgi:hypothetical protein
MQMNAGAFTIRNQGASGLIYMRPTSISDMASETLTWADPVDDMLSMLRELTFRTAIATSSVAGVKPAGWTKPILQHLSLTPCRRI